MHVCMYVHNAKITPEGKHTCIYFVVNPCSDLYRSMYVGDQYAWEDATTCPKCMPAGCSIPKILRPTPKDTKSPWT